MSDTSMGQGWWQASDLKWYPPEQQPGYVAPVAPDSGLPGPDTLQQRMGMMAKRMSVTAWMIALGSFGVAISSFMTWSQGNTTDGLGGSYSEPYGLNGEGRFLLIAFAVGVVVLALPLLAGTALSKSRRIGLTVVAALLASLVILWTVASVQVPKSDGVTNASIGFGEVLCWAALIAICTGVILAWTAKSKDRAVTA